MPEVALAVQRGEPCGACEECGIDGHVALDREGKDRAAVDPDTRPATYRMSNKLATLEDRAQYAGTQVAVGDAQRVGQGGAGVPMDAANQLRIFGVDPTDYLQRRSGVVILVIPKKFPV